MGYPQTIDPAALAAARRLAGNPRARAIRERASLSLADLGAGVGVSGAAVQRWEAGLRRPGRDVALRYASILDALARQLDEPLNELSSAGEPSSVTTSIDVLGEVGDADARLQF
jgi:transcriptional regulator with XRE-family HTH domain